MRKEGKTLIVGRETHDGIERTQDPTEQRMIETYREEDASAVNEII